MPLSKLGKIFFKYTLKTFLCLLKDLFLFMCVYMNVPLEAWRMSWISWVPCSKSDRWVTVSCRTKFWELNLVPLERMSAANWGDNPPAYSLFLELDSPFGPIILRFGFFQCRVYLGIPIGTSLVYLCPCLIQFFIKFRNSFLPLRPSVGDTLHTTLRLTVFSYYRFSDSFFFLKVFLSLLNSSVKYCIIFHISSSCLCSQSRTYFLGTYCCFK